MAKLRKRKGSLSEEDFKQYIRNTGSGSRYLRQQDDEGGGKEASQHRCREGWKVIQVFAD